LIRFRDWCLCFALTIAAVVLSVAYLDRPISRLANDVLGRFEFVDGFTGTPGFFSPLAGFVFAAFVLRRVVMRPFGHPDVALLLSGVSLIAADIAKQQLKYFFGRTWPKYEHPSFIYDGVYGFNPFHAGHVLSHSRPVTSLQFAHCLPSFGCFILNIGSCTGSAPLSLQAD